MKITVICKASTHIGLGHLIRTNSFINQVLDEWKDTEFDYIIIGDDNLKKLILNKKINIITHQTEFEIPEIAKSEFLILDMIEFDKEVLIKLQKQSGKTVLLSPVFNCLALIDYYFGRTKYLNFEPEYFPDLKIFTGLEYAIIQENCKLINAGIYEENLKSKNLPIAISMGGGDASNKTLEVLKSLKNCKVKATFWVMIGEGYKYSFDQLIDEIRKDTSHEIILAKTNSSMWSILKNCVLCILPGGITSYEAVYAGLPTINFFEQESHRFLLQEIFDNNAAYDFGIFSEESLKKICDFIDNISDNPKQLLQMHVNTKMLIDGKGAHRIFKIMNSNY